MARPKRSSHARSGEQQLYAVLTLGLLIVVAWLWWKGGQSSAGTNSTGGPVVQPRAETNRSATNASVQVTSVTDVFHSVTTTTAVLNGPSRGWTQRSMALTLVPTSRPALHLSAPTVLSHSIIGSDELGRRVLEAQIALAREAISPGSIDGVLGAQTRAAVRAFQKREGLSMTGSIDPETFDRLRPVEPALTEYSAGLDDLARLQPLGSTWLAKSQQDRLEYETLLELVAEKFQAHPNLIRELNPTVNFGVLTNGSAWRVPNVAMPPPEGRAALVRIFLAARILEAFDGNDRLLAHFPCSIAQRVEKRPAGERLHVTTLVAHPNYTFNPTNFPESAEGRRLGRKLVLPPGPNNPVGTVWIGLDKPGYGIHGTPRPEEVGRTESHGCFRLANWNAEYLYQLVSVGTPVVVDP